MRNCYYRQSDDGHCAAVAAGVHVWYTDSSHAGTGMRHIYRTKTHALARASVDAYIALQESLPEVLALHRALRRATTTAARKSTLRAFLAGRSSDEAIRLLYLLRRVVATWRAPGQGEG